MINFTWVYVAQTFQIFYGIWWRRKKKEKRQESKKERREESRKERRNNFLVKILWLIYIMFSYCYRNKLPETLWLKTIFSYSSGGLKSDMAFMEHKFNFWQNCVPSGSSRKESIFLPFPVLRGCLHSLTCSFPPPTSTSKRMGWVFSHVIPLSCLLLSVIVYLHSNNNKNK